MWTEAAIAEQIDTWVRNTGADAITFENCRQSLSVEPEPEPEPEPKQGHRDWLFLSKDVLPVQRLAIMDVIRTVADISKYGTKDILSPRRHKGTTRARQLAMFLAVKLTSHPLTVIGRTFNRDHSTVLHAVNKVTGNPDAFEPELSFALEVLEGDSAQSKAA
jgi:hypothetical protein